MVPVGRGPYAEYVVAKTQSLKAEIGELVEYTLCTGHRADRARITRTFGPVGQLASLSEIAIHGHGLRTSFSDEVEQEAASLRQVSSETREDLRHFSFVTIDPEGAQDHDDAVCAISDTDCPGGHIIWCAIADVAHFVRSGTALDATAKQRGNSTYFPDLVLPMLPSALSTDLCSLHEGVDRPCLAVCMKIDSEGRLISHQFKRVLIRSRASLSYQGAQRIMDGINENSCGDTSLKDTLLRLQSAYRCRLREKQKRQPLELDIARRKVVFSTDGKIESIGIDERHECHRMIEEFMILANVCAAATLIECGSPHLCRAHDPPKDDRIRDLETAMVGLGAPRTHWCYDSPADLNRLVAYATREGNGDLAAHAILRGMSQAVYRAAPSGHFGLNLPHYTHFTSPIRRYSDLLTHRILIRALGLGPDGATDNELGRLPKLASYLSQCERRSVAAEHETLDRFTARFLTRSVGKVFSGIIASVQPFGLFVRIDAGLAEGLIPVSKLGFEYFEYDEDTHALISKTSGKEFRLGQKISVILKQVDIPRGRLSFILNRKRS